MSADKQASLFGTPPKPHLTAEPPTSHQANPINKPREWYCSDCGARVTVSLDGSKEFGHRYRRTLADETGPCPHRIPRGEER